MPERRTGQTWLQHFGLAIRQRRESLGYSQEALAERAGIHRNYMGSVERGERNVALVNMVKIARALGVTLSTLVAGIEEMEQTSKARPSGRSAQRG